MITDLIVPIYIGFAVQDVTDNGGMYLREASIITFVLVCLGSVCTGHRSALFSFFADNVTANIRDDYFESIVKKNVSFYDVTKMGDIRK
jgi:ABC-type multidrug transport system fused ATPase/permease subunit